MAVGFERCISDFLLTPPPHPSPTSPHFVWICCGSERLHCFQILDDFDCMLNQTNLVGSANNNKYYVIQVLKQGAKFYAWNRWGRVVSVLLLQDPRSPTGHSSPRQYSHNCFPVVMPPPPERTKPTVIFSRRVSRVRTLSRVLLMTRTKRSRISRRNSRTRQRTTGMKGASMVHNFGKEHSMLAPGLSDIVQFTNDLVMPFEGGIPTRGKTNERGRPPEE